MKKWLILILCTCFLLGVTLSLKSVSTIFIPTVTLSVVKPSDVQQTMQCTGKIVVKDQEDVTLEVPVIAGEISVREGDEIKEGDLLFTVDKDGTVAAISAIRADSDFDYNISALDYSPSDLPSEVFSPVSGTVLSVGIKDDTPSAPGTALVSIAKAGSLQIVSEISEEMISEIKVGQRAIITGSGFKGREYGGVVLKIGTTAKQVTTSAGTQTAVKTEIGINDADEFLKPGYTANIEIVTDLAENVLVVPYDTVLQDDRGMEFMYVYTNGWLFRREIVTNRETAEGLEVVEGIYPGETVARNAGSLSGISLRINGIREENALKLTE